MCLQHPTGITPLVLLWKGYLRDGGRVRSVLKRSFRYPYRFDFAKGPTSLDESVDLPTQGKKLENENACSGDQAENFLNFFAKWWAWVDLNHRPRPYQGRALAT
jgi:hypothetical protein